ncbi:MBL fold metallo-hydrolase [Candidatus Saccharibacteria bacterium]|nr:MBL fold metallo-hydrolase [Candidatus Saccharibacteria bacterium]
MKITKFEHSGLAIEKDGRVILCDPVEYNNILPPFDNVAAVIITHKHSDHLQLELITKIIAANSAARIFCPADASPLLKGSIVVRDGEEREVENFKIKFFGKNHASVVPEQIPCENIGFVIDDQFANPGDAFTPVPVQPEVLCVPISAPWCKISDCVEYIKSVNPQIVIPMHDAVLSDMGKNFSNSWIESSCKSLGIKFALLAPGASIETDQPNQIS